MEYTLTLAVLLTALGIMGAGRFTLARLVRLQGSKHDSRDRA
jgi:hypothetical protein